MELPPGQRAVRGFPRFGIDRVNPPPRAPEGMNIEVSGQLARRVSLDLDDLARSPRREVVADFHCVAGWTAIGLRWQGVLFRDVYRLVIEPALAEDARVGYVVFVGLDDYRSIVMLEDALADDVLIADRLDGEPLPPEHGAPVRLVSPRQYGYMSTKHLCRIELYRSEPVGYYHPRKPVQRALTAVRPHRRARVAQEERRRHLPSWLTRRVYRLLVRLPAPPLE
jgi:DMSO/TMAO reductase YedYZ molybdopterin-dependent catalytic subunit